MRSGYREHPFERQLGQHGFVLGDADRIHHLADVVAHDVAHDLCHACFRIHFHLRHVAAIGEGEDDDDEGAAWEADADADADADMAWLKTLFGIHFASAHEALLAMEQGRPH